jgi:hypothetical protein
MSVPGLNYKVPTNAQEEHLLDSGFTEARRKLYHLLGQPFGTETWKFGQWIAASNVDRDGNFPGNRSLKCVEHSDGQSSIYIDGKLIEEGFFNSDDAMRQKVFGTLGVRYECVQG